jgi:hypothetical protein
MRAMGKQNLIRTIISDGNDMLRLRTRRRTEERRTMSTNTHRETAEIIPFPVRARASTIEHHDADAAVVTFPLPRVARVACGNCWYHEAAIQDDRARNT